MTTIHERELKRVSRAHPCPVCQKPDWCGYFSDGSGAVCTRVESPHPTKNGGWIHWANDPARPKDATPKGPWTARAYSTNGTHANGAAKDWAKLAAGYAAALDADRRRELAEATGLPEDVLPALGTGWYEREQAWTFPYQDAGGRVIGLARRFRDGSKKAAAGARLGLHVPAGWAARPGPVFLPEGPTDTLALTACGLPAIGRASNMVGGELLAELLPPGREFVVVGENDQKPDGSWPGRTGAEKTAGILAAKLRRPVPVAYPPEGVKDVRDWLNDEAAGSAQRVDYARIGRDMAEHFRATATSTDPPVAPPPRWPEPVDVTDLVVSGGGVEFVWDGCVARGHITLLSALMKAGKTTLLGLFLKALQNGLPFLGRPTRQCRTLLVSEESEALWVGRRDAMGLDAHLSVMCRPLLVKPSLDDWVGFVGHVAGCAAARGADHVVIDTVAAFAPWKSENDSAEVMATMTPLNALTRAGRAVTLFHHFGKADGSEGRAARGSTALAAACDVLLEFRRYDGANREDRRRVLTGLGRFEDIPDELVIELTADGTEYATQGDRRGVAARELADAIAAALPDSPPGAKCDDVHAALPEAGRPRRGDVMKALQAGAAGGRWCRGGSGKPHDPWKFWGVAQ